MKWRKAGVAFWCSFVVALAAFSAFFVLLVYHAGRGFMLTDAWMAQNYWLKDVFAERMKSPKIVLLGGSAMAFSIDSSVIEEMCGMPVINLGLHAGLPFRFCLESVSRHVKKGDVVVVALEFNEHFGAGEEKIYSDLSICAMLGMAPEFQRTLTPRQLLQLYFGYGCKWLDHLIANLGVQLSSVSSIPLPTWGSIHELNNMQACQQAR